MLYICFINALSVAIKGSITGLRNIEHKQKGREHKRIGKEHEQKGREHKRIGNHNIYKLGMLLFIG